MERSLRRTERTLIRLILGSVAAAVLLIAGIWGGYRFYRGWQERHLVRRAAAYMSGGDLNTASLTVRRALQLDPDNLDANRVLAEIAEKAQDRSAIELRAKVAEANPNSIDDALALVRAALWFNDLPLAEKTLAKIAPRAQDKPSFYAASGRLAEMKNDSAGAEAKWARAVELAPNESGFRFQLALTRLKLNDPAKREQALHELEELRKVPAQRAAATRTLIVDAAQHRGDPQRVRTMAEELQGYGEANFGDRLIYLEILRQLHDPEFANYLTHLKTDAPAKAADLGSLLSWMVRNGLQREALDYANGLPASARTHWPVPVAIAEAYAQMKDWAGLEKETRESNWGGYEFLRHAYLARALRAEENPLAADQELSAAQKEASANTQSISMLAQTIADWGWQNEALDLLWLLAKNPETKAAALRTLYQHYANAGDTSGIFRALTKLVELNPDDIALQNNLAQASLLLGVDVDRARRLAAEVSAKDPANPAYRSTYAFALLSNGDVDGALRAMNGLSAEQTRDPSTALYYGLILAAAGEKEKAREYLGYVKREGLLPEEKALLAKAEGSLD